MISATCLQPASALARKQPKPSEKTALPGTIFLLGPGFDGFACKSTNSIHLDVNRPTFVIQLYGRDKRNLIFRSATSLAATELSAEVGVVNMDDSLQEVLTVTLLHGLHQLVLDPPSSRITYPKLSPEFHRRDPVFSVGDEIDGLEPCDQGKLCGVKYGACCYRRLMATTLALVPLASAVVDHAEALSRATLGTIEAIRPASILQRRMALLLSPKGMNEVGEGKPSWYWILFWGT